MYSSSYSKCPWCFCWGRGELEVSNCRAHNLPAPCYILYGVSSSTKNQHGKIEGLRVLYALTVKDKDMPFNTLPFSLKQNENCRPTVHRLSTNSWPTNSRQSTDNWPTVDQQLTDNRLTKGKQSNDSWPRDERYLLGTVPHFYQSYSPNNKLRLLILYEIFYFAF